MFGEDAVKPSAPGVKLTWDDLARLSDDGMRHELVDGEHIVTPTPVLRHQRIVMHIGFAIGLYLREHPIGAVFSVPVDVILSAHDVVEPDVLFYTHERARTFEVSAWIRGVPNLVVEVASPSTRRRDQTVKRALYERFGVDEYWLVDPDERVIVVLRLRDGVYEEAARLSGEGDVLRTPLLPGWTMAVAAIFAQADGSGR